MLLNLSCTPSIFKNISFIINSFNNRTNNRTNNRVNNYRINFIACSKNLFFIIVAVCLNACVNVPELLVSDVSQSQLYTGRFSINYFKDGALAREQGNFEWKIATASLTKNNSMQLSLLSPFNTTIALIAFDPNASNEQRASLITPVQTIYAADLNSLMDTTLGWQLPLENILLWLNVDEPKEKELLTDDWTIEVINRHKSNFPKLIIAKNEFKKITARIVLDDINNM
jgi:outer membrane biogenesis lipoprotein LolB